MPKHQSQFLGSALSIERHIHTIRARRVMLDQDLADIYGVPTKVLNQAVKRNLKRFPEDFMFRLTPGEKAEVVTICDHLLRLKFSPQLPYAFTENGVAMLSSVLNSEKAIQANIQIMRTFTKIKEQQLRDKDLEKRLSTLERSSGAKFRVIFQAIREIMNPPIDPNKRPIGFHS